MAAISTHKPGITSQERYYSFVEVYNIDNSDFFYKGWYRDGDVYSYVLSHYTHRIYYLGSLFDVAFDSKQKDENRNRAKISIFYYLELPALNACIDIYRFNWKAKAKQKNIEDLLLSTWEYRNKKLDKLKDVYNECLNPKFFDVSRFDNLIKSKFKNHMISDQGLKNVSHWYYIGSHHWVPTIKPALIAYGGITKLADKDKDLKLYENLIIMYHCAFKKIKAGSESDEVDWNNEIPQYLSDNRTNIVDELYQKTMDSRLIENHNFLDFLIDRLCESINQYRNLGENIISPKQIVSIDPDNDFVDLNNDLENVNIDEKLDYVVNTEYCDDLKRVIDQIYRQTETKTKRAWALVRVFGLKQRAIIEYCDAESQGTVSKLINKLREQVLKLLIDIIKIKCSTEIIEILSNQVELELDKYFFKIYKNYPEQFTKDLNLENFSSDELLNLLAPEFINDWQLRQTIAEVDTHVKIHLIIREKQRNIYNKPRPFNN
jgi:hypothetical protein